MVFDFRYSNAVLFPSPEDLSKNNRADHVLYPFTSCVLSRIFYYISTVLWLMPRRLFIWHDSLKPCSTRYIATCLARVDEKADTRKFPHSHKICKVFINISFHVLPLTGHWSKRQDNGAWLLPSVRGTVFISGCRRYPLCSSVG